MARSSGHDKELRKAALSVLSARYDQVTPIVAQGIMPGARVKLRKASKEFICAVKTTAGGRISFARRSDGSWSPLSEVNLVSVVRRRPSNPAFIQVEMYDQTTLLEAFEQNYAALKKHDMGHLPSWIAPEQEAGVRFTGSGFGARALWSELVSIVSKTETGTQFDVAVADAPIAEAPTETIASILGDARIRIARIASVEIGNVHIDLRIEH